MADNQPAKKQPRIRKTETVRERNLKATQKAEKKANKSAKQRTKHRVRRAASSAAKPLKKPASILTWPFRTKPVRFIGRWLGRILWPRFLRNAWAEIKLVTWPSRKVTWNLTIAVLIFALIFGLSAAGIDWVLDKIIKRIIFRA